MPGLLSALGWFPKPQGAAVIMWGCAGNLLALPVTGSLCRMFLCLGHFQYQTAWGWRRSVPGWAWAFLSGFLLTIANRSCLNSSPNITAIIKDCARCLTEVHGLHTNEAGVFPSQMLGKSFWGSCERNSSRFFPDY